MSTKEYKLHTVFSIKKETFLKSEEIKSEIFSTTLPNVTYQITLTPDHYGKNYTAIELDLLNNDEDESDQSKFEQIDLKISSANFQDIITNDDCVFPWSNDYTSIRIVFIKREDILNPENNYFVDDILTMEIRGTIFYKTPIMNLGKFLMEKENKDFTFHFDNRTLKAHKFILRQFSSILGHGDSDEITIQNFEYSVVYTVVRLCYGIDNRSKYSLSHHLFRLIEFANTYDMPVIKEQLEHKLIELITTENVCKWANKSLELKTEILRCFCVNFLSDCIKNGKPFNGTLNDLNLEIKKLVFDNSFCHTQTL